MIRRLAGPFLTKLAANVAASLRKEDSRFLYWAVYYPFNFGDWIGPFLYQRMVGRDAWFASPSSLSLGTVIMSAGSILSDARRNCTVWGSGIIARNVSFERPHRITAVRGPITHQRCRELGLECPQVYGDPAILLPKYYTPQLQSTEYLLGIIPHYTQFAQISARYSQDSSVRVIDVRHPIESVVDAINTCRYVASSSLHGLIVANAYGIPAVWTTFADTLAGDDTKFFDYYESVGNSSPRRLPAANYPHFESLAEAASGCPVADVRSLAITLESACPFPRSLPPAPAPQ